MTHTSLTAHVHGKSGTLVVSAQTPYDRQMLREHLERLSRRDSSLTLEMDGTRWTVARRTSCKPLCAQCARCPGRLSCSRTGDTASRCLECVLCPATHDAAEGIHE